MAFGGKRLQGWNIAELWVRACCERYVTKTLKKTLPIILSLLGVALFTFIAAKAGIQPVMEALGKVGVGGFFLLVLIQLVLDVGLGLAWKAAVPQIGLARLTGARFVRDAAGACLDRKSVG